MKFFLALIVLFAGYLYLMLHTTDAVLGQTQQLGQVYQSAADYSDQIQSGQ